MQNHLYNSFAQRWCKPGSTLWFYSDPHFNDLESYKLRFPKEFEFTGDSRPSDEWIVNKLDEMQIKNINSKCGRKDTLVILGDVGNVECIKKLKAARKILIMGNHDAGASNYERVIVTKQLTIDANNIKEIVKADADGYLLKDAKADLTTETITYLFEKVEDNHLFDEVYEGTLQIGPKLLLSHEMVDYPYCLNIHGHTHDILERYRTYEDKRLYTIFHHYCAIAEAINYIPVNLGQIIEESKLGKILDIHRDTISMATLAKRNPLEVLEKLAESNVKFQRVYEKKKNRIQKEVKK